VGTKANQTKKVEADAEAICKNAVEAGNTESAECKTARMTLDFIDGRKRVNRLKSAPKKVYQRLLDAEKEYYAMAVDDTTSYSNVAPIMKMMKELSYPEFIEDISKSL
jgi:plasmid maintenance system killer protein